MSQDVLVMYCFAPVIAVIIFVVFKVVSHFKW